MNESGEAPGIPLFRHEWIIASLPADRDAAPRDRRVEWFVVDSHPNLRGPYTAAVNLIHLLLESSVPLPPELLSRHQLTLRTISPAARDFPASEPVADWLEISREGNAPSWTLRLAHGLTDFVLAFATHVAGSSPVNAAPPGICFTNADRADSLDREFFSVLLRRAEPGRLRLRICSSSTRVEEPLKSALEIHTQVKISKAARQPEPLREPSTPSRVELLRLSREYVESDCTADTEDRKSAYTACSPEERRVLHGDRARSLEAGKRTDLSLGPIPFHYEQAGENPGSLLAAANRCMQLGYYNTALDWAMRGRAMIPAGHASKQYSELTRHALFALLLLRRFPEVEAMCDDNLARSEDSALLAHTTYAKAILLARLYEPARRDFNAARAWIEKSAAFTLRLPDSDVRTVNLAFLRNTLALVEMRTGQFDAAYDLLTSALGLIASDAPGKFREECVLLFHNRARLHTVRKQYGRAIDDFTELLRHRPGISGAYLDRGLLHQRSGAYEEALRDYSAAIEWSPPYPEPHLNRAQALAALGRPEEALAEYARVLELAPDHIEAIAGRGCLLFDRGDVASARKDAETGLRLVPKHAKLLCLRGLVELKTGDLNAALASFTESIEASPGLADAWANRATVLFKRGEATGALRDLDEALALREDAAAFYNRARIFESQKRWTRAIEDYSQAVRLAASLPGRDTGPILKRLTFCQGAMAAAAANSRS